MLKSKTKVVPLRFLEADNSEAEFNRILDALKEIYKNEVEFLESAIAGEDIDKEADAVLFPVMWTNVYTEIEKLINTIHVPVIVLTTTVGVSLMFDWESVTYMKQKGLQVFNPHSAELAKTILRQLP